MSTEANTTAAEGKALKQCCANLYESDLATLLIGDSFHPGGLRLTEALGRLLGLSSQSRVLDVASGKGMTALFLAERFGCEVVGIDYSGKNVQQALQLANERGFANRIRFEQGDAERLPIADGDVSTVLCECSFCRFSNKAAAAQEFARVLAAGGRIGTTDLTRTPALPKELEGLLAWVSCIAAAQPVDDYLACFRDSGFQIDVVEQHDTALLEMVDQIRLRLFEAELLAALKKLPLSDVDFASAERFAMAAKSAIKEGRLGYVAILGTKKA